MLKTLLKNYLKKRLTPHPKHYYLYRWLVSLIEDKEQIDGVCCAISYWALSSVENGKLFQYIKDVFVLDNQVYIYTDGPGFLIGPHGRVVNSIKQEINYTYNDVDDEKTTNYEVNFIEMNNVSYTRILHYIHVRADY